VEQEKALLMGRGPIWQKRPPRGELFDDQTRTMTERIFRLMRLHCLLAVSLVALAILANAQSKPDRTLEVKLNYTGAGKVDQNHKIFIFLFDTPDFMQGNAMPIGSQSATAKDQTVTFSGLSAATVYAVAAFDPKGEYDGMSGPPPTGSSLGMYSKDPGTPGPVNLEAGKTTHVDLAFDDTSKMQ
jgi:hypothetical protein